MAANFWTSSHCKQLLDPEEVNVVRGDDKDKGLTLEELKMIKIHMTDYLSRLAQFVKVRQRVVATAVTYFRRVYVRYESRGKCDGGFCNSIRRKSMTECDPRLVAPTCLYLAAKAEESTVQARLVVFFIRRLYTDEKYRYDIKDILEMEMKLLEALDYYLIIYHPYRALTHLLPDAGLTDLTTICWGIINDTYRMDLILIHPPYMIALACIYIASAQKDRDTTAWFEELRVDMNAVKNISMEILDFYDSYRPASDERINAALNKLQSKA